ncbi:GNVR domain-containing protein [Spirosoma linguale]|uniref:Lipopolysaccharide biosynthesis protein n=1 Tax=Spirosoma linguale (strain ATCC 33905 / DSM 74 / LMG 10896 / Claus 1) TaxID=504472 RepID=D2QRK9_SPILD|nr:lipopolysaccharide biosynthesis protein [Spirosoma linguale DSM 74]
MSVTEAQKQENREEDEIEIRLSDIVQFLKDSRRRVLLGSIVGLIIGALYAFSKPNVYTSQVTVMPELQAKAGGLGGLGGLAGLAGIDLNSATGGTMDAIRPDLYPDVLKSIPFALYLLSQPVYSEKLQAKMTLQEFINRVNRSWIKDLFAGGSKDAENRKLDPKNFSKAIQITKEQEDLVKIVQTNMSAAYDKKTGILTLAATESDPVVAATEVRLSLEYLTNYIVTYRTEKARKQVAFLTKRVSEAKGRYQSAEYALSSYRDRNRSLFLQTAKLEEQRLQADYLLEQSVYNELSKQLEQAKIKVQEETPVFKVLEPPVVPLRKSAPKRTFIMLGFAIAGVFVTLIILLTKRLLHTNSTSVL